VLTLIPVPKNPHGVNVTPDGRYVVASGKLSPTVSIIDTKTLKIVAEPEVGLGRFTRHSTTAATPSRHYFSTARS
jgi:nitrous oxide reductase